MDPIAVEPNSFPGYREARRVARVRRATPLTFAAVNPDMMATGVSSATTIVTPVDPDATTWTLVSEKVSALVSYVRDSFRDVVARAESFPPKKARAALMTRADILLDDPVFHDLKKQLTQVALPLDASTFRAVGESPAEALVQMFPAALQPRFLHADRRMRQMWAAQFDVLAYAARASLPPGTTLPPARDPLGFVIDENVWIEFRHGMLARDRTDVFSTLILGVQDLNPTPTVLGYVFDVWIESTETWIRVLLVVPDVKDVEGIERPTAEAVTEMHQRHERYLRLLRGRVEA